MLRGINFHYSRQGRKCYAFYMFRGGKCAGFVLVGGRSSRMGRDKALLRYKETTLVKHVAHVVLEAAGSVVLVGRPERYGDLQLPVIADTWEDAGPLGGIHAALKSTTAEWNLIVACDMPALTAPFLRGLLAGLEAAPDILMPVGPSGKPEPLCAVYHRRSFAAMDAALQKGLRRITEAIAGLVVRYQPCADGSPFANLNTPEQWLSHSDA
ncbi:MAG: molybdenum cofactor guanylyltransferase [Bryobacteraceae bacterium]